MSSASSITDLIGQAQAGDSSAFDAIFKIAYDDLRELASKRLRDSGGDVFLDTTSLVHESFLRFTQAGRLNADEPRAFPELRRTRHALGHRRLRARASRAASRR